LDGRAAVGFVDTGLNIPESQKTLLAQQAQLLARKRPVQMFPAGTSELPLPEGIERFKNRRGVFHFRPEVISAHEIATLSDAGRENEILNLGPFNKTDVAERMEHGELLLAIAEFDPEGIEVRAAAGTHQTVFEQRAYFEATKEDSNTIAILDMAELLRRRLS
jgi:hypothetical protein